MRDILFRGKLRHDKRHEWVFGSLCVYGSGECTILRQYSPKVMDSRDVIPETVGQWTGLKDNNGTRIFEGDILKGYQYPFYNEANDAFNYYAIVMWFDTAFGLLSVKAPKAKVVGRNAGNVDDMSDFSSDESRLWAT